MVECELSITDLRVKKVRVLIDTWWNVNKSVISISKIPSSFNRYMVECECVKRHRLPISKLVLIDTWWNVNAKDISATTIIPIVLIDTWWNVNHS